MTNKTDRDRAGELARSIVYSAFTYADHPDVGMQQREYKIAEEKIAKAFAEREAEIRKECEAGWVSVNDRIPELGDYSVLAYWGHGGIGMIHVEDYFRDITNGLDADGNQLYTKFYLTDGITHWMPLPAAPKGEL